MSIFGKILLYSLVHKTFKLSFEKVILYSRIRLQKKTSFVHMIQLTGVLSDHCSHTPSIVYHARILKVFFQRGANFEFFFLVDEGGAISNWCTAKNNLLKQF